MSGKHGLVRLENKKGVVGGWRGSGMYEEGSGLYSEGERLKDQGNKGQRLGTGWRDGVSASHTFQQVPDDAICLCLSQHCHGNMDPTRCSFRHIPHHCSHCHVIATSLLCRVQG